MKNRAHTMRLLAGLSLILCAVVAVGIGTGDDELGGTPSRTETSLGTAAARGDDGSGELVEVQGTDDRVGAPVRVSVPRLDITSRLDDLAVDSSGELERPPQWQVAGWYADGPRPGEAGPAVIAGHVDSPTGPAVFARLSEVQRGDRIEVTDAAGAKRTFQVTRTEITPKRGFPTKAVYGPTPDSQLRLITCDGDYVRGGGGYQDNLLVFATERAAGD